MFMEDLIEQHTYKRYKMGAFDQENYEIRSRLPEWWKSDLFLEVVNNYSVQVVTDMLQEFLPY